MNVKNLKIYLNEEYNLQKKEQKPLKIIDEHDYL